MTGFAGTLDQPVSAAARPAAAGHREPLAVTVAQRRAIPHLHAFFPDYALTAPGDAPAGTRRLAVEAPAQRGPAVFAAEAIWRAPAFGRRRAPVALVLGRTPDPLAEAVARPGLDGATPDLTVLAVAQCCSLKRIKPLPEFSKKPNFQCVEAIHEA